jgi:hypothetical protein
MHRRHSTLFHAADRMANPDKLPTSTPSVAKLAQQTAPAHFNLERARSIVLLDLGEAIPQVTVDYFFDYLLPKLPDNIDFSTVLDNLKEPSERDGEHVATLHNNRWTCFPVDPIHDKGWENDIYRRLEELTQSIHEAAGLANNARTVVFKCCPNGVPSSSHRDNSSRPDAYAIDAGADFKRAEWHQIALPAEFKKNDTEADDVSFVLQVSFLFSKADHLTCRINRRSSGRFPI